ncbi:ABC-type transport auxiliary lipoprotein family protein [Novosphingobium sp.]|uniref:ABC-type transport auxiliary lipoprotein family protein n=1 Tax=Novosphingobium sp. TaxID=1874826 RepID=UPI00286E43EA|nr:ABC-type transport auxiliary lipoprotein family protein [Novosphingobium sp.]
MKYRTLIGGIGKAHFGKIAAAGLVLALSGCLGLGGGKPPPTLFTLTADKTLPAGAALSGNSAQSLIVLDPETDQSIANTRIAVQVDASNVAYLPKSAWVERPSRLFGTLLAETIRAGGKRIVFGGDDGTSTSRNRLGGRLSAFGYDAREQAVIVRYDAVISGAAGAVSTRRFEAKVPGVGPKPELVAPALNRAANQVAAEVADWVG